jgi:flagellar basal-body rod protein FlgB
MGPEALLQDNPSVLLNKMLDLVFERQRIIANNLANVSTLGYIWRETSFEDALAAAVNSNAAESIRRVKSTIVEDHSNKSRFDGNTVKAPLEMNAMMQSNIYFNLLNKAMNTKSK